MGTNHRADIDGLRAIAALSVLLYHFGVPPFTGGFVGVDVFFVISGYLITGIVFTKARTAGFSFREFYGRRSRRLLPALLATIIGSFAVGFLLFPPEQFMRQSGATIFALLGLSNFYFWSESGYFDPAAILKPLLHTWSLAVELQFYLVWPVFVVGLARARMAAALPIGLLAATLVTFSACVYAMHVDPSAAFFLTPFRGWEFAVGGLIFTLERRRPRNRAAREVLYLAGLALILYAVLLYDGTTPFPGYAALPPVLGAALMLLAGESARASIIARIWPMRSIGLISYSLYLVHWPIIVFATYRVEGPLTPIEKAVLVTLALVLSLAMFRFIENEFRTAKERHLRAPFSFNLACAAPVVLFILPAGHSWAHRGWLWRVPESMRKVNSVDIEAAKSYVWQAYNELGRKDDFVTGKLRVLVVGDSQAGDFTNLLVEGGFGRNAEIITRTVWFECGVPYIDEIAGRRFWTSENPLSMRDPTWPKRCRVQMDRLMKSPALQHADVVIIGYYWRNFSLAHLDDAIRAIDQASGAKIYLLGDKQFTAGDADLVNRFGSLSGIEKYAAGQISPATRQTNEALQRVPGTHYVDVLSLICPKPDYCHAVTDEGFPILWDPAHFTRQGIEYLWRVTTGNPFAFIPR